MKINELRPASGSRKAATRVGRGIGSGLGKTSGRGHKGQKARSGASIRPGFEGGQMPLSRRIPKRGFTNIFKKEVVIVKLSDLNRFEPGTVVTPELLLEAGLLRGLKDGVKVLADGEVDRPLTVRVQAVSKNAAAKIEAAGGKVEVV